MAQDTTAVGFRASLLVYMATWRSSTLAGSRYETHRDQIWRSGEQTKGDAKLDAKVGERETEPFAIGAVIFPIAAKES
ncbi:hypothetical protein IFM47457_02834 [Aspergillus lentulus]|nr:hypothetical protein IFM47457_02834 [Aspergillus lentulus]